MFSLWGHGGSLDEVTHHSLLTRKLLHYPDYQLLLFNGKFIWFGLRVSIFVKKIEVANKPSLARALWSSVLSQDTAETTIWNTNAVSFFIKQGNHQPRQLPWYVAAKPWWQLPILVFFYNLRIHGHTLSPPACAIKNSRSLDICLHEPCFGNINSY